MYCILARCFVISLVYGGLNWVGVASRNCCCLRLRMQVVVVVDDSLWYPS